MRFRDQQEGFTLIEVLVALVIVAVFSGVFINAATLAGQRHAQAERQRKAVFLARSLLAEAAAGPYHQAQSKGTTNGLRWIVEQTPRLTDPRGMVVLADLTARVVDHQDHLLITAETRRLKRLPGK